MAEDDSFHPLGSEWEAELEDALEDTDYDTDLGMAMAEDAMAVTSGDLSEAEFHERYHDAVQAEFGQDDRPTAAAFEAESGVGASLAGVLEAFDEDSDIDRREAMKKMGLGAAAIGLGAAGTVDDGPQAAVADEEDEEGVQWGMVLDLDRCDGCLACVTGCREEHHWDPGMNWMYVLDWEDPDEDLNTGQDRLIRPCQHCTNAPCEKVCPVRARHTREEDGLVLTDYETCIGCRYCQVACPYGVNYFEWGDPGYPEEELDDSHIYDERNRWVSGRAPRGVMSKCTFCPSRQDGTGPMGDDAIGSTACEDACPTGAIQFGDMNDPESDPQQYLENPSLSRIQYMDIDDEEIQTAIDVLTGETDPSAVDLSESEAQELVEEEAGTVSSTFKLLEEVGTDPNVVYIGDEPGPRAEQVDGPISYDEAGLVDRHKNITDEGTVRFELAE